MSLYKPQTVNCNGETFKVYLSEEKIRTRVADLAKQLNRDYSGKKPIFIGVLNGAFIFLSDLLRHISIPSEVDFLKLSSYGDEKVSSGEVRDLKDIDANIEDRHVLLVEDIVDTGLSMKYMVEKLEQKNPASIATVTLLYKPEATRHDIPLDYVGFRIPSLFVLGYGLDYAQEGRNLAQIYILDEGESRSDHT
ncbi:hypoxanthine phosphoribosyltransferase [Halalkalibaculum sp. DA3122]|uniref:hypoxanthine phosphoribosyltransferase n=1 Tax=Halalkalibaculum sp. DA3122 TaxID=3373607 RepID=UPI003753EBFB